MDLATDTQYVEIDSAGLTRFDFAPFTEIPNDSPCGITIYAQSKSDITE